MNYDAEELQKLIETSIAEGKRQESDSASPLDQEYPSLILLEKLTPIVREVVQKSMEMNVKTTVTLADLTGSIIYCYRMPGCILAGLDLSTKKAYSAVAMNAATASLQQSVQPGADLYQLETMTNGEIVTFGGGVPLRSPNGRLIGGVGVSGAPRSQQDHELAGYFAERFLHIFFSK
ncbi:heme-binding protein [Sporolactobacillus shoreicorticis]|uniref:Heme-binding protein n=1 Tax=Sporolactobacillus shoreicorticis TaxID=1923877 RepID=A0ABW5S3I8_9BACL|nr:heme-binding protein [Sporolactobacillus shoreicorticis]MCO7124431.1 heme-binding protein [Sporolactobacillus shoreicorticis]